MRWFYLVMMVVGTVVPWVFFGGFFATEGLDLPLFVTSLFRGGAAAGFTADVLLSIVVFPVWSSTDAQRLGVRRWWLVVPASCLVGLSLSLPLYLYLRETHHSRGLAGRASAAPAGVAA